MRPLGARVPAVPEGGALRLVAPSGVVDEAAVVGTIASLDALGFSVQSSSELWQRTDALPYLAGTDAARAHELMEAFADDSVHGVVCVRGGYGAMRLLGSLDPAVFSRHPKPLVGFSDVTALHGFLLARCGLVSIHGPLGKTLSAHADAAVDPWRSGERLRDMLRGRAWEGALEGLEAGRAGESSGPLLGGNLTLVASLVGTPFFPPLDGAILFLEEIGEAAYRIDRLLTQLALSGVFDRVAGLVLGDVGGAGDRYVPSSEVEPVTRARVLELTASRGIPVAFGLPCGHGAHNVPLGFGCRAILRCSGEGGSLQVDSPIAPSR